MKNKIVMALFGLAAFLCSAVFVSTARSYGERDGGWTASEKRQMISLLEQIANNTEE